MAKQTHGVIATKPANSGYLNNHQKLTFFLNEKKELLEENFFDDILEKFLLVVVNSEFFFGSAQNLAWLCLVTRGNLSVIEKWENIW